MQSSELAAVGGPRGYVYNLKTELDKSECANICFIESGREKINKYKNKIENLKSGKFKRFLVTLKSIVKHWLLLHGRHHNAIVDINEYDVVHFHSTLDMYAARDSLKNYCGKVALTSHSPTLLSKEIYDSRSNFEKKFFKSMYKKLIRMDEYAFSRADFFIFPCREAEEPYFNNWDKFESLKLSNQDKFRYVLTGINQCSAKIDRKTVREKYNIPQNAFVVSYVGRHNEIKGYDTLKEIGEKILRYPNTYFLVAGREMPLQGLKNERWIEIGWTNDPHSLIAAADVFILPNKETYFDLVLIEVLSLGQLVVASRTGGNKFFENKSSGIKLYDTQDEAVDLLLKIMAMSEEDRFELAKSNLVLYKKDFTCEIFAERYLQLYSELLQN